MLIHTIYFIEEEGSFSSSSFLGGGDTLGDTHQENIAGLLFLRVMQSRDGRTGGISGKTGMTPLRERERNETVLRLV
jgi:hypothetical protein